MSDTADKPEEKLPKASEVLAQIKPDYGALERSYAERFNRVSIGAQEDYEHLKGLRDHYRHKASWSRFLMLAMAFMIGFQSFLLWMVGGGHWTFAEYEWLLPALLVQNLGQVIGLAVFVVKALFKDLKR